MRIGSEGRRVTSHRSVSQVTQYERCPHAYYLQRIARVWEKPAAWTAQGTAFHAAIEAYELGHARTESDMLDEFRQVYAREIDRALEHTPNTDYWFDSWQGSGAEDIRRRYLIGLDQVQDYYDWRTGPGVGDVVWVSDDGTPGVEIRTEVDFDGVAMVGYIDLVLAVSRSADAVHVRDAKSGNRPGETFQLKVYGMSLEKVHGVEAVTGDYWLGKKSGRRRGPTKTTNLDQISESEVVDRIHAADEGIKAEKFDPRPDKSVCFVCSVRSSCQHSAS